MPSLTNSGKRGETRERKLMPATPSYSLGALVASERRERNAFGVQPLDANPFPSVAPSRFKVCPTLLRGSRYTYLICSFHKNTHNSSLMHSVLLPIWFPWLQMRLSGIFLEKGGKKNLTWSEGGPRNPALVGNLEMNGVS